MILKKIKELQKIKNKGCTCDLLKDGPYCSSCLAKETLVTLEMNLNTILAEIIEKDIK